MAPSLPPNCWTLLVGSAGWEAAKDWCCNETLHGPGGFKTCFDPIFSHRTCCLGLNPFREWALDLAIVGFPGCGTTSLAKHLGRGLGAGLVLGDNVYEKFTHDTEVDLWEALLSQEHTFESLGAWLRSSRGAGPLAWKDAGAIFDKTKIWVFAQIPGLHFIVLLRDPVTWVLSSIYSSATACSEPELQSLGLCTPATLSNQSAGDVKVAAGVGRRQVADGVARIASWLRVLEDTSRWELVVGLPMLNPLLSVYVKWLVDVVGDDRVVLLPMEALEERPVETMLALSVRLGFPHLFDAAGIAPWNQGPRPRSALDHEDLAAISRLRKRFVELGEYESLAVLLTKHMPSGMRLPNVWVISSDG